MGHGAWKERVREVRLCFPSSRLASRLFQLDREATISPSGIEHRGTPGITGFSCHLEAGLSLGASLNYVGWVDGGEVFPDKLRLILPMGCCRHLVSNRHVCSSSRSLKGGYPVLRNSVRVPTIPSCKLPQKAILKERTQVLEEPASSLSGLNSLQPFWFQCSRRWYH